MKSLNLLKEKINTGKEIDVKYIINLIDKYDIISFDIFDTLLKRNVKRPTDVFMYIEKKYNEPGFCEERIEAEKKARIKKNNVEITLEEIYNEMSRDFYDKELEAEAELLIANKWMLPVYKKAISDKKVIIISDMYLSEDFISNILKREGFVGYDKIYLSSKIGKTKKSGELFEHVLNEIGEEKKVLHIGDSYVSDFKIPKKYGIEAVHIPTYVEKKCFKIKQKGIESNIINSFINNTTELKKSEYYRFGYEKFGMFLWGYSKWLHKEIIKADISNIYFFSRDGLIMKKVFDLMYNDVDTYYLEVSRRSLRVPILWMNHNINHVINMVSPSKQISLVSLFEDLGLKVENYKDKIEKHGFDAGTVFDRNNILENRNFQALYSEIEEDIDKVSKEEYLMLVEYIKKNKLKGKFAIVDIGWSGGMQRYLYETLMNLNIQSEIKGFYIGVADYYKRNIEVVPSLDLNGYLFDFLHDKEAVDARSSFVGLFETLFLEQDGSVKNYTYDNGVVKANRLPYEYMIDGKPTNEYLRVKEIQEGAIDFIKRIGNIDIELSASDLFTGIKKTGSTPNKQDIKMFADFRFFDDGETMYLAKPRKMSDYFLNLKLLKKDFLASRWKIGFMKRLFKINMPYEKIYKFLLRFR